MPATITPPSESLPQVEKELHELEDANDVLDQRTGNLEMRGMLATLFAFFALAVAIAALAVSLVTAGNKKTVTVPQAATTAAPVAPSASAATPAAPGTVNVALGEMFVRPDVTQGAAGKITFHVQNTGKLVHEMIVGKAPIKGPLADGRMSEATSVGEVAELKPGATGSVKLSLKPGAYILYCNVPGHFVAGQHVAFTVAAS